MPFGEALSLTTKMIELFQEDPKNKSIAQGQLQAVLDLRIEPCIKLWRDLWNWFLRVDASIQDDVTLERAVKDGTMTPEEAVRRHRERDLPAYDEKELSAIAVVVDEFLKDHGAIVSIPCFITLLALRNALRSPMPDNPDNNDKIHKVNSVTDLLFVRKRFDKKNKEMIEWGLFYLLRDDIGSNSRSIASILPASLPKDE